MEVHRRPRQRRPDHELPHMGGKVLMTLRFGRGRERERGEREKRERDKRFRAIRRPRGPIINCRPRQPELMFKLSNAQNFDIAARLCARFGDTILYFQQNLATSAEVQRMQDR